MQYSQLYIWVSYIMPKVSWNRQVLRPDVKERKRGGIALMHSGLRGRQEQRAASLEEEGDFWMRESMEKKEQSWVRRTRYAGRKSIDSFDGVVKVLSYA